MLKHIPILRDYFVSRRDFDTIDNLNDELFEALETQRQVNSAFVKPETTVTTVIGFDDNTCEPIDPVQRLDYVKDVDYFHDKILKDKLKTSIADIREMLSNIHVAQGLPANMQRAEYDFFLRGMEAMAWKMNEWATTLQGERKEILQEEENNK